MAFKKMNEYNEERYGGFFMLRNDGDFADVVFLYRNTDDVLMADVHYIKSDSYSGYVHCCGKGCPACAAGIRVDSKLFIPVYNVKDDQIQFFDRSLRFENQLHQDVFNNYPNPSEYVFRITRHGAAGSRDTRYEIQALARNTGENRVGSYEEILAKFNATMPEKYEDVCREFSAAELSMILSSTPSGAVNADTMPDYQVRPRTSVTPEPPAVPQSVFEPVVTQTPVAIPPVAVSPVEIPADGVDDNSDIDDVTF